MTSSTASHRLYDHIVFDLDDTLLDTHAQLIPQASREACERMIAVGLATDLQSCLVARDEIAQTAGRRNLFENIVQRFGTRGSPADAVAEAGFKAFYDRRVESTISLAPGLRDTLRDLRNSYGLHLVTAGHPETQQEKLKILEMRPLFDSITIVNTFANETKRQAFEKIASQTIGAPPRHLSVGNRLDTDIAPAKELGWKTCWVRYGEYARSTPLTALEKPDVTIANITELIEACRL
jgi:FMN phosphatase YigB (HAD superfamily)